MNVIRLDYSKHMSLKKTPFTRSLSRPDGLLSGRENVGRTFCKRCVYRTSRIYIMLYLSRMELTNEACSCRERKETKGD